MENLMSFQYEGKNIDVSHLSPFHFLCNIANAPARRVDVRFSEHTYTRKRTSQDPPGNCCFRGRIFCQERYDLSLKLPELVRNFPQYAVYETLEKSGYVYFAAGIESPTGPYYIFFTIKKYEHSKKQRGVSMYVQSAYPREKGKYGDKKKLNTINFARLVENTFMNRPIKFNH